MDDYLHSFESSDKACRISHEVAQIHRAAGFELRGWAANDAKAIQHAAKDERGGQHVDLGGKASFEKTLGMRWDTTEDLLSYALSFARASPEILNARRKPTKREALSVVMSLFDPLGLVTPITTPAKRILQEAWRLGISWDEVLPDELNNAWLKWVRNLSALHTVRVPRCYDVCGCLSQELHTFVDASEAAYAAATYWRFERCDGSVKTALACAKSRVTPLKPTSIPRLELQAALLGSRLARSVEDGHDWKATRRVFWSDSRTTLAWIRASPRTFKTFVAHRLAEIEDLTKVSEWRWVPSKENVADDATRDTPPDFAAEHRWFSGPAFLEQGEESWPREQPQVAAVTGEERVPAVCCATIIGSAVPAPARFSSWLRLVRATARVQQFIELCRAKTFVSAAGHHKRTARRSSPLRRHQPSQIERPRKLNIISHSFLPLEARHLKAAEELLLKTSQREAFMLEMDRVRQNQKPTGADRLAQLALQIDDDGVLRIRSRVGAAENVPYEQLNPAVLDGNHIYTKLYVDHVHRLLHHGGVEIVINELRQRCWIVRLRLTVRSVIKSCLLCRIRRTRPTCPPTGDHPASRLAHHERPFTNVGLDYFGPIEITVGRRHEKRYVALFTCLTVRALHLEIAASLSTDSAISALRRFIARRGCPKKICSDNGTNFKGADTELRKALAAVQEAATNQFIEWHFIPPGAPFMGGAWERLVRSTKEALRVTLHERYPHEETLATLLAEVENTINSRPLTHVTVTPEEPEALTPNHILLGAGSHSPPPGKFDGNDEGTRALWRRAQWLADEFWRRWVREYLPLLQNRREPQGSGQAPLIGDVVLVVDPSLPRNTWPRGRVEATYPGKDGVVRVVDIQTGGKILRRPVKKVVVLTT